MSHTHLPVCFLLLITACNVTSTTPPTEGIGQHFDAGSDAIADAGDAGHDAQPEAARGFLIVHSDYTTSSVSAIDKQGKVLTKTLITSGSKPPGLSLALGSDTVLPTQRQSGKEVVLIDRTNHALHWLDLSSAQVTRQVSVGPGGFAANPYDYVQVHSRLSLVTRFETNSNAGQAELDEGGDLLALDPRDGKFLGRVDFNHLTETSKAQPRPSAAVSQDGRVYVVLGFLDNTWAAVENSRLAKVDPEALQLEETLDLGLRNCEGLAASPDGKRLAVACKGDWQDDPPHSRSGIVIIDIDSGGFDVERVLEASELVDAQVNSVSFASNEHVLFTSYGTTEPAVPERAWLLEVESGDVIGDPLVEAAPFSLGMGLCVADDVCAVANAEAGVIELFNWQGSSLASLASVALEDDIGLPPRYIGAF